MKLLNTKFLKKLTACFMGAILILSVVMPVFAEDSQITALEILDCGKTEFWIGEEVDITKTTIKLIYANGIEKILDENDFNALDDSGCPKVMGNMYRDNECTIYAELSTDSNSVVVSCYNSDTDTHALAKDSVDVTVIDPDIKSIEIVNKEMFTPDNIQFKITHNNDTVETITASLYDDRAGDYNYMDGFLYTDHGIFKFVTFQWESDFSTNLTDITFGILGKTATVTGNKAWTYYSTATEQYHWFLYWNDDTRFFDGELTRENIDTLLTFACFRKSFDVDDLETTPEAVLIPENLVNQWVNELYYLKDGLDLSLSENYDSQSGTWAMKFSGWGGHFWPRIIVTSVDNSGEASVELTSLTTLDEPITIRFSNSQKIISAKETRSMIIPATPELVSKTTNSVTLQLLSGYEYSLDGVNFQSSNIFENLTPGTDYEFYQRMMENEKQMPSGISATVFVTTDVPDATQSVDAEIEKLITDSEKLSASDYTAESWNNYVAALQSAQNILSNQNAGTEEKLQAKKELESAITALTPASTTPNSSTTTDDSKSPQTDDNSESIKSPQTDDNSENIKSPQTGGNSNVIFHAVLMMISAVILATLILQRRQQREKTIH